MILPEDSTKYIKKEILEIFTDGGFERIGEALQILINAAMLAEREKYLGAGQYERTESRSGHANGFKPVMSHEDLPKLNHKLLPPDITD